MSLLPGAEAFTAEGGPIGALLCHGFTSTPQSLRPWAEFLAGHGLAVSLPRLPGHGTTWRELSLTRWPDWYAAVDRGLDDLAGRCEAVVVMGLSMGGTLAVRLAEQRAGDVRGLVLVNPSLLSTRRLLRVLPVLRRVVPAVGGVAGDVKRAGAVEVAYDRVPLAALASLVELWRVTSRDLARVACPVLVYRSAEDHVVEPASTARLLGGVGSADVEERLCLDSYHVATLDNDAEAIFAGSLDFVRRVAGAGVPTPTGGRAADGQ